MMLPCCWTNDGGHRAHQQQGDCSRPSDIGADGSSLPPSLYRTLLPVPMPVPPVFPPPHLHPASLYPTTPTQRRASDAMLPQGFWRHLADSCPPSAACQQPSAPSSGPFLSPLAVCPPSPLSSTIVGFGHQPPPQQRQKHWLSVSPAEQLFLPPLSPHQYLQQSPGTTMAAPFLLMELIRPGPSPVPEWPTGMAQIGTAKEDEEGKEETWGTGVHAPQQNGRRLGALEHGRREEGNEEADGNMAKAKDEEEQEQDEEEHRRALLFRHALSPTPPARGSPASQSADAMIFRRLSSIELASFAAARSPPPLRPPELKREEPEESSSSPEEGMGLGWSSSSSCGDHECAPGDQFGKMPELERQDQSLVAQEQMELEQMLLMAEGKLLSLASAEEEDHPHGNSHHLLEMMESDDGGEGAPVLGMPELDEQGGQCPGSLLPPLPPLLLRPSPHPAESSSSSGISSAESLSLLEERVPREREEEEGESAGSDRENRGQEEEEESGNRKESKEGGPRKRRRKSRGICGRRKSTTAKRQQARTIQKKRTPLRRMEVEMEKKGEEEEFGEKQKPKAKGSEGKRRGSRRGKGADGTRSVPAQDSDRENERPCPSLRLCSAWRPIGPGISQKPLPDAKEERLCFGAIRHGRAVPEVRVRTGDCVQVNSADDPEDIFVGRVLRIHFEPDKRVLLLTLLWFYTPRQLPVRPAGLDPRELFASRHLDTVNADSVQGVAHVLSFSEYCRYRAQLANARLPERRRAPECRTRAWPREEPSETNPRREFMPRADTTPLDMVFFCRGVFSIRSKRVSAQSALGAHQQQRKSSRGLRPCRKC